MSAWFLERKEAAFLSIERSIRPGDGRMRQLRISEVLMNLPSRTRVRLFAPVQRCVVKNPVERTPDGRFMIREALPGWGIELDEEKLRKLSAGVIELAP